MSDFEIHAADDEEQPDEDSSPGPLSQFAQRHRRLIGFGVAVGMLGFFAWSVLELPPATVPGFFGIVQRFAFPLMCLLIAAVGATWGLRLRSLWTTIAAYAVLGTYVCYLALGWIYENFIAA